MSFDEKCDDINDLDRDTTDGEGRKTNVTMDKISTMTLTEFKSLLTSALSVPDEAALSTQTQPVSTNASASQRHRYHSGGGGATSTASTPGASEANRQLNWGSLREKAKSVRDNLSSTVNTRRPSTTSTSSANNSPAIGRRSLPQSPDVEVSEYSWPRTTQSVRKFANTTGSSNSSTSSTSNVATAISRPKTPSSMSRPKTPTAISRPKTPTAISRPKTPTSNDPSTYRPKTPTSNFEKQLAGVGSQKEEYKMARPKTPSQMKREAVAKVAGAISNWVESRPEMDQSLAVASSANSNMPKTPARQFGTSASFDENDEDSAEVAMAMSNPRLAQTIATSSVRDRPETPSRIPKPCFTPRPNTPKSIGNDIVKRATSSSPPTPPQTLSLSQNFSEPFSSSNGGYAPTGSVRVQNVISRVVKSTSATTTPIMSPQGSMEREMVSSKTQQARSRPQTPTGNKSYKDIYSIKRCTTPNSQIGQGVRSQPSRCITPGPREKWSLGESSSSSREKNPGNKFRKNTNSMEQTRLSSSSHNTPNASRRNKSLMQRSSSISNLQSEQQMMITNEITFSDDEEINELMRNTAMKSTKRLSKEKAGQRAASVDAKKLVRQNANAGREVIVISRNNDGKHGVQVSRKGNAPATAIRRPQSRGGSTDRAAVTNNSSAHAKFRSQTPDPSMFRRKSSLARSNDSNDSTSAIPKSGENKSFNRTEAWVDSTLSDTKRKLPSRPKRSAGGVDIPISELEPRPLDELQAMLSDNQNGTVPLLDAESLEAPPEDPEMYKKMEKLFEKYREMELRASVNDTPGAGVRAQGRLDDCKKDVEPVKTQSHRSLNASSRSGSSIISGRTSSGSVGSAGGACSSNPPISSTSKPLTNRSNSTRSSNSEEVNFKRSTSSPGSFNKSKSCEASPAIFSPTSESHNFPGNDSNNIPCSSNGKLSIKSKCVLGNTVSESNQGNINNNNVNSDCSLMNSLKEIDSEVAKDPAALISKIKEILRVRPRKDENSKIPTKIPAPRPMVKTKRSKSVSNLFQMDNISSDLTLSTASSLYATGGDFPQTLSKTNSMSNSNVSYSEFVFNDDETGDVLTEMSRKESVHSDSGDSSNRCETPVPKLATPLTTGRSTFINRRGLSQEKENLSNSQTSLSSRSVMSTTEDEADYV